MREERFPWGLGAILILAIVGGIGFWLGSASASPAIVQVAAPVAPAPAPVTPTYPAYAAHGGGFPLFPLFFGLIFLVVIFKVIRHAAWSGYPRGGPWSGSGRGAAPYGPGGFGGRSSRGWHQRSHGWYGPGFDADDSMDATASDTDMGQQSSQTTDPASDRAAHARRTGFWNGRDVPPMVDEMFQRWHSRMHAEPSPDTKGEPAAQATRSAEDEGGSLNIPPNTPPIDPSI